MRRWPLTLVRRGAKVPDDGTRWWQELPEDQTPEGLRSVGYEVVEVVPLSEIREALLDKAAVTAVRQRYADKGINKPPGAVRADLEAALDAALPTDSEGER